MKQPPTKSFLRKKSSTEADLSIFPDGSEPLKEVIGGKPTTTLAPIVETVIPDASVVVPSQKDAPKNVKVTATAPKKVAAGGKPFYLNAVLTEKAEKAEYVRIKRMLEDSGIMNPSQTVIVRAALFSGIIENGFESFLAKYNELSATDGRRKG